jgi:hypothetical protein
LLTKGSGVKTSEILEIEIYPGFKI